MADPVSVLYVDPDRTTHGVGALERENPDLSVLTAESAADARARLDAGVDCVVCEYDLPEGDGIDLLAAIEAEYGLPTVLVTDRDDDSIAREAFSRGIDEYVHRPGTIQPTVLARRIERAVAGFDAVEESSAHLRALTHAASDVIVTADAAGTIRFVNEAVEDVFGYRPGELVGEPIETLAAGADAHGHVAGLRRYIDAEEGDESGHAELEGRRKDGSTIPIEVSFGRFEHAGQRFFTGIVRDVSERERLQSELGELIGRVTDAFFGLDSEWRFTYLNERADELINPEGRDLIGEDIWERFPGAVGTAFEEEYRRAMETQTPVDFEEYFPPLSAWFEVHAYPSETGLSVYFRDVTGRRRRERQLETLNTLSRELTTAETVEEVSRISIEAADETLSLPIASIKLYDPETGYLEPIGGEDSPAVGHRLFDTRHNVPWRVFVDGEPSIHDDLASEETPLRSAIILPLGDHGVLIAGDDEPGAIAASDVSIAEILAANTTSALDRVDRERALREQTDRLEEKNAALRRVHRLNEVIRGILRELTRAPTHEAVVQSVCERLADADPYRFAWIGTHDPATDEITPEAFAGVEEGYLEEVTVTADERRTGQGPAGRAFRTHEPHVQNDLYSDPPFEPWRQAALERGYRASISIPIVHRDSIYGVLNLYADEAGAFDETERSVLTELGEAIGYALAALDRQRALVSDRSIDLEFRVRDPGDPVLAFVREHGLTIEFENTVYRADGTPRVFVTIPGVDPDRVERLAGESDSIGTVTLVREQGDDRLFACTLTDSAFLFSLVDHGVFPRTLASGADGERVVVRIPGTAAVRSVIDLLDERYAEVELLAQRERDDPITTQGEFEAAFNALLTERQEEVLRAATVSGFFEWPRGITAQQLADVFGVSQPTVSRHIRAGERILFELLFDEE
ncbi:bacterio-opsin activator domain-containing protein [Halalkalicoccus sp. NIPERK01]|uniref:bacterio-opsin activator domain-containing protein n=1 Tax=Halalkalicoccus sp. NIPERK01 TaxID=3053469 RepID=UPI00256EAAD3|nr:bacterio-opsin activator domain-containing protein [Halalkalicoccus sp. NIPERK01]MDL5363286.1 bacterio-opsin activator domain-containing protein [Halalkalicoccus sp. NIPERK01]